MPGETRKPRKALSTSKTGVGAPSPLPHEGVEGYLLDECVPEQPVAHLHRFAQRLPPGEQLVGDVGRCLDGAREEGLGEKRRGQGEIEQRVAQGDFGAPPAHGRDEQRRAGDEQGEDWQGTRQRHEVRNPPRGFQAERQQFPAPLTGAGNLGAGGAAGLRGALRRRRRRPRAHLPRFRPRAGGRATRWCTPP